MKVMSHQLQIDEARREADRWRRISNRLFELLISSSIKEEHKEEALDAIETYLNYALPEDDE